MVENDPIALSEGEYIHSINFGEQNISGKLFEIVDQLILILVIFHLLRAQLGHFGTIFHHCGPQFRK